MASHMSSEWEGGLSHKNTSMEHSEENKKDKVILQFSHCTFPQTVSPVEADA